jgi:hypothetical protein
MARKLLAWTLIILGSVLLLLSIAGIVAVWVYNAPLTDKVTVQLKDVDTQLAQAQTTLDSSQKELERALRIVDSAQAAINKIKVQTNSTGNFLETIQSTIDDRLLPELKTTHGRIESARTTLQQLQSVLTGVQGFLPIDLSTFDKTLSDLISSANSIDAEITNVEALGQQASLFVSDSSFLLGGDLTETRTSLENFVISIKEYKAKIAGWREQVTHLTKNVPRWIDQASIVLTVFLFWLGLSQIGLILHGLTIRRGFDPFLALRPTKVEVRTDGVVEEVDSLVEQD